MAEALYQKAGPSAEGATNGATNGAAHGASENGSSPPPNEDVIDAEFKEA